MKKLVFLGAFIALSATLMLAQADPEQTALAVAQSTAAAVPTPSEPATRLSRSVRSSTISARRTCAIIDVPRYSGL